MKLGREHRLVQLDTYRRRLVSIVNRRYVFAGIVLAGGLYLLIDVNRGLQGSHSLTRDASTNTVVATRLTTALAAKMQRPPTASDGVIKRLYDHVMEEFHHQDYQAAEAGFRFFLALYPDAPLATHAQYWLGECAFRLGRYQEAIVSFDAVLSQSPLVPTLAAAALMRKGLSYDKLGERVRSRHLLELVVAEFPDSYEAAIARRSLTLPLP